MSITFSDGFFSFSQLQFGSDFIITIDKSCHFALKYRDQKIEPWRWNNIFTEIKKVLEIKLPFKITTSFSSRNMTFVAYKKKVNFFFSNKLT